MNGAKARRGFTWIFDPFLACRMAERTTKAVTAAMPMAIRAYMVLRNMPNLKVYISMGFTAFPSFGVCVICILAYFLFVMA